VPIAGFEVRPFSFEKSANSASRTKSARRPLVWLSTVLVGSGLLAAALFALLPWPHRDEEPALAKIHTQGRPAKSKPATKTAPSPRKPSEASTKHPQEPRKPTAKDGLALPAQPEAQPTPVPNEPEKQLGLAVDQPKTLATEAPPEREQLALPKEPPLAVAADAPKTLYAERTKPKTPEYLAGYGGTSQSQAAVEDGLNWLARHQSADGHWGPDGLGAGPESRCEPTGPCQGPGEAFEVAQTGLALLAFQAAGNYDFNGQKYSDHVTAGLDYLVGEQAFDGSLVGSQNPAPEAIVAGATFQQYFMYEHAIATFALSEACAVAIAEGRTPETRYLVAATRAVQFIERLQHFDGGWRYTSNPSDISDCSVSGWVMLALKTAREARIKLERGTIPRMTAFFVRHQVRDRTYYFSPAQQGTDAMTGVGMMAVEFFQNKHDSPFVSRGARYLADRAEARHAGGATPAPDYYLWYNCTMAMFQAGGEAWERWNRAVRDEVIGLQVHGESCERGSWPPNDQWSSRGGRIYSTALAVLTLEVYYRFQRLAGQSENQEFLSK
jgi:hypothetical protein